MTKILLEILDKEGVVKAGKNDYEGITRLMTAVGEDFVDLATQDLAFEEGDQIRVTVDEANCYLTAKLDETLDTTLIFLPEKVWTYTISMTANAIDARPDKRFMSKRHYLSVRTATAEEVSTYRNWALNPHDQKEFNGAYPHAYANVETRNDATFFACNAIDGIFANFSHGEYPYQSWGINRQADAALTIDFGRPVTLDKVGFTLRNDFPHDSYWTQVSLSFSDGSKEVFHTEKKSQPQYFSFAKRTVTSVTFSELIQAEDESPFPALTEIELFGQNA